MSQTESVHEGRRRDAVRNHERVIAAARELFSEQGLGVTVPQVAERAGVGKATVYRSYPAKQDVVVAVAREQFRQLAERTRAALEGEGQRYAEMVLNAFRRFSDSP
ncbi:helix-turn-helix domain-containing protein [Actinoplanes sp. NPDC048796]|uniref:TetR/AcrR family transcriptional regulator n=1 Tax=unclassified Actinoplanes TaxID=2626549 RepID=UPI0033F10DE9